MYVDLADLRIERGGASRLSASRVHDGMHVQDVLASRSIGSSLLGLGWVAYRRPSLRLVPARR